MASRSSCVIEDRAEVGISSILPCGTPEIPFLKSNPAALPYPISAVSVDAANCLARMDNGKGQWHSPSLLHIAQSSSPAVSLLFGWEVHLIRTSNVPSAPSLSSSGPLSADRSLRPSQHQPQCDGKVISTTHRSGGSSDCFKNARTGSDPLAPLAINMRSGGRCSSNISPWAHSWSSTSTRRGRYSRTNSSKISSNFLGSASGSSFRHGTVCDRLRPTGGEGDLDLVDAVSEVLDDSFRLF